VPKSTVTALDAVPDRVTVSETEPALWETDTLSAVNPSGSAAAGVVATAAGAVEVAPDADEPLVPPHPVNSRAAKTANKTTNRSTCDVLLVQLTIQTPQKK
jgi:hypothetical protein